MTAEELVKKINTMIILGESYDSVIAVAEQALEDAYNDGWDAGAEQAISEERGG